jgi:hypothetical protein
VPATIGLAWWLVASALGFGPERALAGLAGAGVTLVCTVGSMVAIGPWVVRPVGIWMTLWLAGTVIRLLLAPLGTFLLYSATPLDAPALGISVGLTYLLTLLCEAAVLARYMSRAATP